MPRPPPGNTTLAIDSVPPGATVFPGIRAHARGGQVRDVQEQQQPGHTSSPQTCSGCRRSLSVDECRTSETSFIERGNVSDRRTPQVPRSGSSTTGPPNAPPIHRPATGGTTGGPIVDNTDLCTRTSWVDAHTAYKQIKKVLHRMSSNTLEYIKLLQCILSSQYFVWDIMIMLFVVLMRPYPDNYVISLVVC